MKRSILILALLTLIHSLTIGQIISTSKDSLLLIMTEYSYVPADTFFLYNKGESLLTVDSIKTEHGYSYQVEINFSDTTVYFNLINFEPIETFNLLPNDSARVIFSDPDLCPICGSPNDYVPFTDSVTFYSNSIVKPNYTLSIIGDGSTDIKETETIVVDNYKLYQNYPNPFNPTTTISYFLSKSSFVNLSVFNLLGEKVATLVDNYQTTGLHMIKFNSEKITSGIYIYRLNNDDISLTRKMILLR